MGAHRPVVMGRRHAVACGHHLAAQAAYAILEDGGNAIDAGVAAGIVLGVVHSDIVSFAGVAPMIIRLADGRVTTIDGLGTWPRAATCELFQREHGGAIPEGLRRTVVPAAPAAWITALERFGTRSFADVAHAAIAAARDGFAVYPLLAQNIADNEAAYRRWASNRAVYLPDDRPPRPGEWFVQADLARTIQHMADEEAAHAARGRAAGLRAALDAFYRGDIAATICDYHAANGGLLARADLADYRVREEEPIIVDLGAHQLYCCGAWCQGISMAQAAALTAPLDAAALGHNSADYVHTLAECLKLVFADRERYVGDPAMVDVPVDGMLDPAYLAARRELVDAERAWPEMPPAGDPRQGLAVEATAHRVHEGRRAPAPIADPHGARSAALDTSYLAVMDAAGNVFSATPSDTSADTEVIPGTGLAVSSRGSQSRADSAHPASVAPGKRPRLTPNPAMLLGNGAPLMAFGTPGGDVQIQAMLQVLFNITRFGMDVQSAIEAPRFASYSFPSSFAPNDYHPGLLMVEEGIDEQTMSALAARGHRAERWPPRGWKAGGVCVVMRDPETGAFHAGADPRRAGYALAG
ncbi:MAG: gamma-glutamyltransferase [Gammaproteobacteria bacterium]|nr:gamma-glutamyltransferase [Gammaproteobacteria bacterium]